MSEFGEAAPRPDGNENNLVLLLGRIDGKMDMLLQDVRGHEKRIAAVEKKQWYWAGAIAIVGFVVTYAPYWLNIFPH